MVFAPLLFINLRGGKKLIEYFVAYISGHKLGNAKIVLEHDVMSMDDVRTLEKALDEKYKQKTVVLNIIKLREE